MKATIEKTKFDIGDEVWFMYNNRVKHEKVTDVWVNTEFTRVFEDDNGNLLPDDIDYLVKTYFREYYRIENIERYQSLNDYKIHGRSYLDAYLLFSSKQELLDSL